VVLAGLIPSRYNIRNNLFDFLNNCGITGAWHVRISN